MSEHASQKWDGKSRGGSLGTRIFVELIHYCGLGAAYLLLCFVAPYYVFFAPRSTRSVWFFSRRVRGLSRLRSVGEIFATYYTFGQCIIDKMAISQGLENKFSFLTDGRDVVKQLVLDGHGTVLVSAHVGAWETGAPIFGHEGVPFNVTIFDAEHAGVKKAIESEAQERPFNFINIAGDSMDSVFAIKNALEKGEVVCFMGDRFMEGSPTAVRPFMGLSARFPLGPFQVAAALHMPVACYFAVREKGKKYHFFLKTLTLSQGRTRAVAEDLLNQYVQSLEEIVTLYPRQWFNFFPYFLEDPRQKK